MIKQALIAGLLAALSAAANPAHSGAERDEIAEDIFRITARNVANSGKSTVLTGFRVAGLPGVVTALHGVANARSIEVRNEAGTLFLADGMEIAFVDLENDIAILLPTGVTCSNGATKCRALEAAKSIARSSEGFEIEVRPPEPAAPLRSWGYPYGTEINSEELTARRIAYRLLSDLVPIGTEAFSVLKLRNSPSLLSEVLNLDAALVPGLSGAPIFDTEGRVLGIANGGLANGTTDLTWAIAIRRTCLAELRCEAAEHVQDKIAALGKTGLLFEAVADRPVEFPMTINAEATPDQFNPFRRVYARLDLPACGSGTLRFQTQNLDYATGFCSRAVIRTIGRDGTDVLPALEMDTICTISEFEKEAALTAWELLNEEPILREVFDVSEDEVKALARYRTAKTAEDRTLDVAFDTNHCPKIFEIRMTVERQQKPEGLKDTLKRVAVKLREIGRIARELRRVEDSIGDLQKIIDSLGNFKLRGLGDIIR